MFEVKIGQQTNEKLPNTAVNDDLLKEVLLFTAFADSLVDEKGKNRAVGLAAPQCGINKRYCCIMEFVEKNGKHFKHWVPVINPEVTQTYGNKRISEEGCLSWPGKIIVADRYEGIKIKFQSIDHNGDLIDVEKTYYGFEAKILQHEIAHLDGIVEDVREKDYKTIKNVEKVGRNDKCPCTSGKKYKHCCGK